MASELENEIRAVIDEVIGEHGIDVVFDSYRDEPFDAQAGKLIRNSQTPYPWRATPPYNNSYLFSDNKTDELGYMYILIEQAGITFNPQLMNRVTIGSDVWTIVRIEPFFAGLTPVAYEFQLRK